MKEQIRIFYYFIIGAIGGLTAWLFGALLLRALSNTAAFAERGLAQQLVYGAILGSVIGLAVAAYEGVFSRSLARLVKYGGIGLLLGAVAGAIALPMAEALYGALLSSDTGVSGVPVWQAILVGTICWALFGGVIGFGEGLSKGTQTWKGFLGGSLGGIFGGMIYELNRAASNGESQTWGQQFWLALVFALLGAAIGLSIALVGEVLKKAWVEVLDGKFAGRSFDVTKYVDAVLGSRQPGKIGSDQWSAHIYLPGDSGVLPHHAEIGFVNGAPTLTTTQQGRKLGNTLINGRKITVCPLSDGDKLQIGATRLVYRHKRK